MRIISGIAKGRKLVCATTDRVRPVADKVKGSIFNILGPLDDAKVLDLFAGTGSVGLEALSRNASTCVFVEDFIPCIKSIEKNLQNCRLGNGTIIKGHLPEALRMLGKRFGIFTHVFLDPPYDKDLIAPNLQGLADNKLIDAESLVIIEHSPREKPEHPLYQMVDQRKYGQTFVSFLKLIPFAEQTGSEAPEALIHA